MEASGGDLRANGLTGDVLQITNLYILEI